MSEENKGEDSENDSLEEEFQFYFSYTKPLVLDLQTEEERALAAAWVQKLEAEPNTKQEREERLNYLKLLLFVLQRGRLGGIFARQPPSGPLQPFPLGFSVLDMGNLMLEQDDDLLYGGGDAGHIPFVMELSNDLREYVASQEVPNFGVQMYYAWSSEEPIHKWLLFDEEKFPQYILEKIKHDDKAPTQDTCESKKKGCHFTIPEILSTKKIKSPEEIEKSQGRSFLTYMGFVGRMGNFNENCDDDPERLQRNNPSKKCPPKRKKCPGSGGAEDATGEEDFDNFMSGLGGELMNRPCLCPPPAHQVACPTQQPKKMPQSACVDNQPTGNCSDGEQVVQWSSPGQSRRMREPRFDSNMSGTIPQQRMGSPRNNSMNRHGLECSPEDNAGGFPNQGEVCVCTSPPCTCPCPRAPVQKDPLSGRGGRVFQNPSRTCTRPPRQEVPDCNVNRNRGIGTHLTSFTAPDPCTPASANADFTPVGGRTCGGTDRRVMHCYDKQNPDPGLTKTIEKNDNWMPLEGGGAKYVDTDYKMASMRDQLIAKAMENKCTVNSRRGLFNQPQAGPSGMGRMRPQSDYPPPNCTSPPLLNHPLCEHSPEDEPFPQQCSPNYGEFQGGRTPQMYPNCGGRGNANTQKKSQSQCRAKNVAKTPSVFAVGNDAGRLANMANVLRGMKQTTEAHVEKCPESAGPRSHAPDMYCMGGAQAQAQTQTKPCPRLNEQRIRGAGFGGGGNEQMGRNMISGCGGYQAPPPSPQGPRIPYQNRDFGNFCNMAPNNNSGSPQLPPEAYDFTLYKALPNYRRNRCDPCLEEEEEEDDECESSGSLEEPCQNPAEDRQMTLSDPCKEALSRRHQDFYKLTYEEESDFESQDCGRDSNFSIHNDNQYADLAAPPAEFIGTMLSANDSSFDPQWANARRGGMNNQCPPQRPYSDSPMETDERPIGSTRTTPGRASQRMTTFNDSPNDNANPFDDVCGRNPENRRNRFFERSDLAHAQPPCPRPASKPVCSTPLRHHRETFKDLGVDEMTGINR